MRVALLQMDGKLPNLALMRISAHHRRRGDEVDLYSPEEVARLRRGRFRADRVYGSLIFEATRPLAREVLERNSRAEFGGTGWDPARSLSDVDVDAEGEVDYSIYPGFAPSIGFTQRGCRFRCKFCTVPRAEGAVTEEQSVSEIWRGGTAARRLLLLDNDFFGQRAWAARLDEVREGGFEVCLCQGINLRLLTDEQAAALSTVKYRSIGFGVSRIYAAWDRMKDERRVLRGLELLLENGVRAREIMVYMLVGFEPGETARDREYRFRRLDELGVRVYPMAYRRTRELIGFYRWVTYGYFRRVTWESWERHGYQAHYLQRESCRCEECRRRRARVKRLKEV